MNTYQTTQENPIPLIKPQPPLPIIINGYQYDFKCGKFYFSHAQGDNTTDIFDDLSICHVGWGGFDLYQLEGVSKGWSKPLTKLEENEMMLLEAWIDRCKGVSL